MTGPEGDLLRQAAQHLMARPDRAERDDDANDHIDSDTPRSGIATPQPDPSDKRFPSIDHNSYFAQVGTSSSTSPGFGPLNPPAIPRSNASKGASSLRGRGSMVTKELGLSDASGSDSRGEVVNSDENKHEEVPPLSSNNGVGSLQAQTQTEKDAGFHSYPTPPDSKTPSLHKLRLNESGSEDDVEVKKTPTSTSLHHKSISDSIPQHARRPSLLPLSSIVTTSNVLAAHFSNPTDTRPSTPILSRLSSQFHESPSIEKLKKLTDDLPAEKSGHASPRASSTVTATSDVSAGSETAKKENGRHEEATPTEAKKDITASASVPAPVTKGKLTVKISEARGLKRSREPYVVAVFQRNDAAEEFLGHVDLSANLSESSPPLSGWFPLRGKNDTETGVFGEIFVEIMFQRTEKRHYGPEDFQILKLIGKGTFGQVYQVRKKDTKRIYAMKVLQKKVIVQKKEVAHTVGERNILVRTAMADSPFIVGLKFSFQTPTDLYLVTDFMSGGELFWHLQKEGRFDEKRAKFYIAELILALQHLHMHDIVYRDLKPENILLDANGHIALCDFGLSKANLTKNATTNTFCGTTEYLAPEVLLDEAGYTKMVDFWSLGVLVFEMCCGWSPFYAEDTQQMYKNIAFGKVRFPRDTLTTEGRNFVKGLLNRNPKHRLGAQDDAEELKRHAFFADIDWDALTRKTITPPFKPKLKSETDTQNFDPEFTNALMGASSLNARAAALAAGIETSTPLSPGMQANFKGFTFVDESSLSEHMQARGHIKDDYDDMDEDEKKEQDWEEPFEHPDQRRSDRMSGVQKTNTNEDSSMFNGGHFDL
ncbi:putative Serine/threonine-protein kinase SCH9 [Glarea lozoyensis 74030]|uniref:non-specific serine/threonine protein kinase n=1 Tax=Glarea lozoyensis (strain ATCC 74030 / MF5533) TaxID=1104152 RepID=H0EJI6_GLAL7|nr:putative Serine/threonine-protein kinase SCH9 [Glarea lozoyensis 74030]